MQLYPICNYFCICLMKKQNSRQKRTPTDHPTSSRVVSHSSRPDAITYEWCIDLLETFLKQFLPNIWKHEKELSETIRIYYEMTKRFTQSTGLFTGMLRCTEVIPKQCRIYPIRWVFLMIFKMPKQWDILVPGLRYFCICILKCEVHTDTINFNS